MGLERCKRCGTWWDAEFPLNKCPKCIDHVESDPFEELKNLDPGTKRKRKVIFTRERIKQAGIVLFCACVVVLIAVGIYMRIKGIHYYDVFTSFKR